MGRGKRQLAGAVSGTIGTFLCGMCFGYTFIPTDLASIGVAGAGFIGVGASLLLSGDQRTHDQPVRPKRIDGP